jgi:hypothetical protein
MFPHNWQIERRIQEVHQQELLREAEQIRLYKQALNGKTPANPLTWRFLNWLGRQMVSLGSTLQKHYAELAELASDLQTNRPCDEPGGC